MKCEVSDGQLRAPSHRLNRLSRRRADQHRSQLAEAIIEKRSYAGNFSQVAMGKQVYGIVDLWNGADHPYEISIQVGERRGQKGQPTARFHGEQDARGSQNARPAICKLREYARVQRAAHFDFAHGH